MQMPSPSAPIALSKAAFARWSQAKAPRLAAALAYHAIFALAPLLVVAVQLLTLGFGGGTAHAHAAHDALLGIITHFVGSDTGKAIDGMITATANHHGQGIVAAIVSWVLLILGAIGLFAVVQDALNTIWEAPENRGFDLRRLVRERFASFVLLLAVGVVLLAFVGLSAVLVALLGYVLPALAHSRLVLEIINAFVTAAVGALLFAAIFRVLPDVHVDWKDVRLGAGLTAVLFVAGQYLLALYLGHVATKSVYGAAGSLVIILLWLYYASQIFLFGAALTRVMAENRKGNPGRVPAMRGSSTY